MADPDNPTPFGEVQCPNCQSSRRVSSPQATRTHEHNGRSFGTIPCLACLARIPVSWAEGEAPRGVA